MSATEPLTPRSVAYSFIQACLTHRLFPGRPLPAPPRELDVAELSSLLLSHGLMGVFYQIGREQPGLWTDRLQHELRRHYYSALLRGSRCSQEAHTVLTALHEAGIPTIVLKGWALIPTVYGGDHGQRGYVDIDLAVSPRDAARVEVILQQLGYCGQPEFWRGHIRRYRNYRAFWLPLDRGSLDQTFAVEIHWGLLKHRLRDSRISVDELFERALPLEVAGAEALRMPCEDEFVYECGHLAHHRYDDALFRYYEMAARILRAGAAFDWEAVSARARAWLLVIPVQHIVGKLGRLWPDVAPVEIVQRLSSLEPGRAERILHEVQVTHRRCAPAQLAINGLAMRGIAGGLGYLFEIVFPSPAYMRKRYGRAPGGLWPLLYLRRIARGLRPRS